MSDKVTDSSDEQREPDASQAAVDSETQKGDSTNSLAASELVEAIKADPNAVAQLREMFRRADQSDKDKSVVKTNERLDQQDETLRRFAEILNVDPAKASQAENQIVFEQMARDYRAGKLQPAQEPVGSGLTVSEAQALASSLMSDLSQEAQQAVLAQVNVKAFADEAALSRFVVSQAAVAKPVSSSATLSTPSAGGAAVHGIEEATDAYMKNYQAALDRGDSAEAKRLRKNARKDGIPVDQIIWAVH